MLILLLSAFSLATDLSSLDPDRELVTQEEIDYINSVQSLWTAKKTWVSSLKIKDLPKFSPPPVRPKPSLRSTPTLTQIPSSFDSNITWPNCTVPVGYQLPTCLASFAFATSASMSERFCIADPSYAGVNFSPQNVFACGTVTQQCKGGLPTDAWNYIAAYGTGVATCQPWTQATQCSNTCANGTPVTLYYVDASSVAEFTTAPAIQQEIMTNGPVAATMTWYQDFSSYNTGIYTHVTGAVVGTQSVKIYGWGVQNTVNYWIAANSWGTNWGMQGIFWIQFGKCLIDTLAVAAKPLFV
jgi:cathepsin B